MAGTPDRWNGKMAEISKSLSEVIDYDTEYARLGVKICLVDGIGWAAVDSHLGEDGYTERINVRDGSYERYANGQLDRDLTFLVYAFLRKRETQKDVTLDAIVIEYAQRYGIEVPEGVEPPPELSIEWLIDVQEEVVEWLWTGRLPANKLVTLAGPGGIGKSFILCDIATRVSAGTEWPFSGGEHAPLGNVLYVSGEDTTKDTIRPRMRLQGAALEKVAVFRAPTLDKFNMTVCPAFLDTAKTDMGGEVSLVVIDPPSAFLNGVDENSNAEVRGILGPLSRWAEKNHCCIIFNTHFNKGKGKKLDVFERVLGSVGWYNGVRVCLTAVEPADFPGQKLLIPVKCNLWEKLPALEFKIVKDGVLAHLEWVGEVHIDAETAVNGHEENHKTNGNGETKEEKIEEWLIARFKEKPIWPSREIGARLKDDLKMEVNGSFERVKKTLDIRSRRYLKEWELFVTDEWVYGQF